jgi:hypothetical protein
MAISGARSQYLELASSSPKVCFLMIDPHICEIFFMLHQWTSRSRVMA